MSRDHLRTERVDRIARLVDREAELLQQGAPSPELEAVRMILDRERITATPAEVQAGYRYRAPE
jgi:hypothetical protein